MDVTALKARAASLGFALCGIAPASGLPELARLRGWVDRGYAADLHWMVRTAEKRMDPRLVIPGAKTVIALGTVYNTDQPYSTEVHDPGRALISRYAWGEDYHSVIRARLAELHDWMHEVDRSEFVARYYVDTGPVQERVFAQYAGLGWIGKHACLINETLGSWIFLSVMVTTLDLPVDPPALDQCGTCTLCIEACPTQAIVEPRMVDAGRCLSYLTIEERGEIPEPLRAGMANHIYGCDVCQDVCPWNQAPAVSTDPAWQPQPGLEAPRLATLWRLPDRDLRRLVRRTPMTRAKLPMLRRNLAIGLQASDDASDAAALRESTAESRAERPSATDELVGRHIRMKE